jgi:hypothetical protein
MGGEDNNRRVTTKRFTREELEQLADRTRPTLPPQPEPPHARATPSGMQVPTPMSRTQTLHDPLTTQLLAEVARRVQTTEFDAPGDKPEAPEGEVDETEHPSTKRRG